MKQINPKDDIIKPTMKKGCFDTFVIDIKFIKYADTTCGDDKETAIRIGEDSLKDWIKE